MVSIAWLPGKLSKVPAILCRGRYGKGCFYQENLAFYSRGSFLFIPLSFNKDIPTFQVECKIWSFNNCVSERWSRLRRVPEERPHGIECLE